MSNTLIVVAYDIRENRLRTRLNKLLKNYGTPVQYSVFECLLNKNQIAEMKAQVREVLGIKGARNGNGQNEGKIVKYYSLCVSCEKKIGRINGKRLKEAQVMIV